MKQRLLIFFGLVLLIALLVGLNAASYTQKEKTPDSEAFPNRSTYNAGATGTQAIYSLLAETGRKVTRWQEPPAQLLTDKSKPTVLVVIGSVRREFTDQEAADVMQWVALGGQLIVVDRNPPDGLMPRTTDWQMSFAGLPLLAAAAVDPADSRQMTVGAPVVRPVQPSFITDSVNAIQPSRFASTIELKLDGSPQPTHTPIPHRTSVPDESDSPPAPFVHFASETKNLVVETSYGYGRLTYLSDPYIVSNAGIQLADNVQLAVNLFTVRDGIVAFDEFHQGFGGEKNAFLRFFAGTPVVAMFFQAVLLVGLVLYSQSRRFGRPVPEPEPDRLSKLE